jgi:predicted metal-dependent hydrolase
VTEDAAADLALHAEGVARFNAGLYYEAHESWEDLWLRNRSEARPFYQGLIQAAAALHHLRGGRPVPAERLLATAAGRLGPFAPAFLGVAVAPLLVDLARAEAHAHDRGAARVADQAPFELPKIEFEAPALEAFHPHRGTHARPAVRREGPRRP